MRPGAAAHRCAVRSDGPRDQKSHRTAWRGGPCRRQLPFHPEPGCRAFEAACPGTARLPGSGRILRPQRLRPGAHLRPDVRLRLHRHCLSGIPAAAGGADRAAVCRGNSRGAGGDRGGKLRSARLGEPGRRDPRQSPADPGLEPRPLDRRCLVVGQHRSGCLSGVPLAAATDGICPPRPRRGQPADGVPAADPRRDRRAHTRPGHQRRARPQRRDDPMAAAALPGRLHAGSAHIPPGADRANHDPGGQ